MLAFTPKVVPRRLAGSGGGRRPTLRPTRARGCVRGCSTRPTPRAPSGPTRPTARRPMRRSSKGTGSSAASIARSRRAGPCRRRRGAPTRSSPKSAPASKARAIERAPELFDLQPQSPDQRVGAGGGCLSVNQIGCSACRACSSLSSRAVLSARISAWAAARSRSRESNVLVTSEENHIRADL